MLLNITIPIPWEENVSWRNKLITIRERLLAKCKLPLLFSTSQWIRCPKISNMIPVSRPGMSRAAVKVYSGVGGFADWCDIRASATTEGPTDAITLWVSCWNGRLDMWKFGLFSFWKIYFFNAENIKFIFTSKILGEMRKWAINSFLKYSLMPLFCLF